MKIFILALDGLEYRLVKKWRLQGLQQTVCGWIDVSEFKTLLTPIIWASFITGKPPEIHGVKSWWEISSSTKLDSVLHWILYNVPIIKDMSKNRLRKYAEYFGFKIGPPQVGDLHKRGLDTIFDYASKPIILDVPSYNESADNRIRYSEAMDEGISKYEKVIWEIHSERVNKIVHNLDSDWDLFMSWIDLVDQMGHLWMGKNNLKMLKAYTSVESLTHKIRQKISNDTLLLVISDHGMTTSNNNHPVHSSRAFYSLNKDVGWTPQSILDYSDFIKNSLKSVVKEGKQVD